VTHTLSLLECCESGASAAPLRRGRDLYWGTASPQLIGKLAVVVKRGDRVLVCTWLRVVIVHCYRDLLLLGLWHAVGRALLDNRSRSRQRRVAGAGLISHTCV
jgi:hypothetical protein